MKPTTGQPNAYATADSAKETQQKTEPATFTVKSQQTDEPTAKSKPAHNSPP
jgi:hypothetical protein